MTTLTERRRTRFVLPLEALLFFACFELPMGCIAVAIIANAVQRPAHQSLPLVEPTLKSVTAGPCAAEYGRGVNNALDAISLLDLEQKMKGESRTWGEMAEIVCRRLKVERCIEFKQAPPTLRQLP